MQTQNQEELAREPSLNELCMLSGWANVAYAVRCGRRVQPKFAPAHEDVAKMAQIVESALRWTELSLQQEMPVDERVRALVEASCAVAEACSELSDFAAYAAYHSVRGAVMVTESPRGLSTDVFLEVVAAAFGASRVLLSNVPPWVHTKVIAALRADYEALARLDLGGGAERGQRVDSTMGGPLGALWAAETPTW
jgi:hypothetical protein